MYWHNGHKNNVVQFAIATKCVCHTWIAAVLEIKTMLRLNNTKYPPVFWSSTTKLPKWRNIVAQTLRESVTFTKIMCHMLPFISLCGTTHKYSGSVSVRAKRAYARNGSAVYLVFCVQMSIALRKPPPPKHAGPMWRSACGESIHTHAPRQNWQIVGIYLEERLWCDEQPHSHSSSRALPSASLNTHKYA